MIPGNRKKIEYEIYDFKEITEEWKKTMQAGEIIILSFNLTKWHNWHIKHSMVPETALSYNQKVDKKSLALQGHLRITNNDLRFVTLISVGSFLIELSLKLEHGVLLQV